MSQDISGSPVPTYADDLYIERIRRSGPDPDDKNFLIDDPRFTPEAIKQRYNVRKSEMIVSRKKELLEKYGKNLINTPNN